MKKLTIHHGDGVTTHQMLDDKAVVVIDGYCVDRPAPILPERCMDPHECPEEHKYHPTKNYKVNQR